MPKSEESMWNLFPDKVSVLIDQSLGDKVFSLGAAMEDGQLQAEYVLNKVSRLKITKALEDIS